MQGPELIFLRARPDQHDVGIDAQAGGRRRIEQPPAIDNYQCAPFAAGFASGHQGHADRPAAGIGQIFHERSPAYSAAEHAIEPRAAAGERACGESPGVFHLPAEGL